MNINEQETFFFLESHMWHFTGISLAYGILQHIKDNFKIIVENSLKKFYKRIKISDKFTFYLFSKKDIDQGFPFIVIFSIRASNQHEDHSTNIY